jgi:hypothetical protein
MSTQWFHFSEMKITWNIAAMKDTGKWKGPLISQICSVITICIPCIRLDYMQMGTDM